MADEQQSEEQQQFDEKVQRVLNAIAIQMGSFQIHERSGTLNFTVQFQEGQIVEGGFLQDIHEEVL